MRTQEQIEADVADERPFSNGTEFLIWADRHCGVCANDDPETDTFCPILTAVLGGWPREWPRTKVEFTTVKGEPASYDVVDTCTEFERREEA